MHILDELAARGLVADVTDRAGLAELLAKDRSRSTPATIRRRRACTSATWCPTILLKRVAARGPPADRRGRRRDRHDRRSVGQERRAQPARRRRRSPRTSPASAPSCRASSTSTTGTTGAVMSNNADWTRGVGYLEFLRDVGKYLTINYMMAKDSVKSAARGRQRHQLHRVLVHAAAGVRLRAPVDVRTAAGSRSAARISTATSPPAASCRARWAARSCSVSPRRCCSTRAGQKMGKTSTGERDLARPGAHVAVRVLPVLASTCADDDAPRLLRLFSFRPLAEIDELLRRARRGSRQARRPSASSRAT